MAVAYRTVALGGATTSTADRTCTIVPAAGDLLVVFVTVAANTNDTPTMSDNNGSGTYTRIVTLSSTVSSVVYKTSMFVRNALMVNTTSTIITAATGSNTSGVIHAYAFSGMARVGSNAAVKQSATQADQAAGTPAPVLGTVLTGNATVGCIGNATNPAGMTAPTNWTEPTGADTGFASDTIGLESVYRNSGFTGTTVTWGSSSASRFNSIIAELDSSDPNAAVTPTAITQAATVPTPTIEATAARTTTVVAQATTVPAPTGAATAAITLTAVSRIATVPAPTAVAIGVIPHVDMALTLGVV